jgi:predicted DNA-binding antitoxin AbrB/MazE fold protein
MSTTIKGIYENGIIKPLGKVNVENNAEALIIFLDKAKEKKSAFFSAAGSWKDVDTEALKRQIYENRKVYF